jgi:hypothetical protein
MPKVITAAFFVEYRFDKNGDRKLFPIEFPAI